MLTRWLDEKAVGVPSCPASALNAVVLEKLALWWTSQQDDPCSIPIDLLRREAWVQTNYTTTRGFRVNFLQIKSPVVHCSLSSITPLQPAQVEKTRALMTLDDNPRCLAVDAWGLKRLFAHQLRRWASGATTPRDSCFDIGQALNQEAGRIVENVSFHKLENQFWAQPRKHPQSHYSCDSVRTPDLLNSGESSTILGGAAMAMPRVMLPMAMLPLVPHLPLRMVRLERLRMGIHWQNH